MSTPYDQRKYKRLLDDHEARIAEVRSLGDLARQAQAEALESERPFMTYTHGRGGEPMTVNDLLDLDDENLSRLGIHRTTLLDVLDRRRRVEAMRERYAAANRATAESGRLVEALKHYVEGLPR